MIPQEMQDLIDDLKEAPSRDVAIRKAYDVLAERYPGKRLTAFVLPWRIFITDNYTLWNKYKLIPCTCMNHLLRTILVGSGWVTEEDIEEKWTILWFTPHQYLRVKCDDHWISLDIWGANHGIPYDDYARGFK